MCLYICSTDAQLKNIERLTIIRTIHDLLRNIAPHGHEEMRTAINAFAKAYREASAAVLAGAPIPWALDRIFQLKSMIERYTAGNPPENSIPFLYVLERLYSDLLSLFDAAELLPYQNQPVSDDESSPVPTILEMLELMKHIFEKKN